MNVITNTIQVAARRTPRLVLAGALALLAQLAAPPASAGAYEQAKRIYERIAGEPPPAAVLTQMANAIIASCGAGGCAPTAPGSAPNAGLVNAAQIATNAADFYNVTLKNWVIPWTNRDQTVFAPFNDYAATVIGMVRDNVPFNTALSATFFIRCPGSRPRRRIRVTRTTP